MNEFNIIKEIRKDLQLYFFSKIKEYIDNNNLPLSKESFEIVSDEIWFSWGKYFCNYVLFLKYYFNI